jgi:hypothetical protein
MRVYEDVVYNMISWISKQNASPLYESIVNKIYQYYCSTKSLSDRDAHAYFSPYENSYKGFINNMNIL